MSKTVLINLMVLLLLAPLAARAGDSLTLEQATAMALDYSYRIKSAGYDSAAAAYKQEQTRSLRFPTLSLEAKSYLVDEVLTSEISGPFAQPLSIELGSSENFQSDLRLSMPLYTGGRISRQIDIAAANSRAATAGLEAQRMTIAYDSRRACLNLLLSASSVEIARSSATRIEIIRTNVTNLHAGGLADSIDILDAASAVDKAEEILQGRRTFHANAEAALNRMIGREEGHPVVLLDDVPLPSGPGNLAPEPAGVINRAELKRMDHLINASEQSVNLARSEYFPSLSAFGAYSVGRPNRDMFKKEWDDFFSVGLSLGWQFNLGGGTSKSESVARQKVRSTKMSRQALENDLNLMRRVAINNLDHAYRIIEITEAEVARARKKFELARRKQQEGHLTVNRLLEMEEELTGAELQYRASIIQYYLAETDYLYSVGSPNIYGGWQ